jgi:hypothetical protein
MVTISVEQVHSDYVIRFSEPLGLYVLAVATARGDIVWKVTPLAFRRNEFVSGAFLSVDPQAVPVAIQKYVEEMRDVATSNADVPQLQAVIYGEVPDGYKERDPARALERGTKYHVIAMGSSGDATAVFTVAE